MSFDPYAARAQFPILSRTVHGKPLTYLDSAASAQKPRAVLDAMTTFAETSYANVHRGLHTLANEATDAYEAARAAVAGLLNAATPDEIVFTRSGTAAINLVAHSFAGRFGPGDEIVLSEMEHHANIVPWHMLASRTGVTLRFCPVHDDGRLDLDALEQLVGPRTRLVSVTHMSNVLGTINPAEDIVRIAHAAGAKVMLDGCQSVVHRAIDVAALGCDFFVFTGHKLYGPTGIGVLWGRAELLAEMPPFEGGGEMIERVTLDGATWAAPPTRFEAGTPPILEAVGLHAAIDWLGQFDRAAIEAHEQALYRRVLQRLADQSDFRAASAGGDPDSTDSTDLTDPFSESGIRLPNWLCVFGQAPGKGAILAFDVEGAHAHDVAQILDQYGVAVRAGTHCAEPLMARLGVSATARASFALYNTTEDADAFTDALIKTRAFFA